MFTGPKNLLPVHEFHMQFKNISLQWLHFSTVRSMLASQCKGHEFKACHIAHGLCHFNKAMVCIKALTDYNDKLKDQTLQPQTASDKHQVLVLVLFNMSSA